MGDKKLEFKEFDARTTKWSRWILRFEGTLKGHKIPDEDLLHTLLEHIGQDPFDLVCDKIQPNSPYDKTYEEIVNVLKEHYEPTPLEIAENFRFHIRKQQEGESVQEFLAALRKLAVNCNFKDYLETALRNYFVFGLRSERIQGRLLEIKDLSLAKAIEIATALELSAKEASQLHQNMNRPSVNALDKYNERKSIASNFINTQKGFHSSNFKQNNFQNNKNNHFQKKDFKCFRCGSKSHLANKCVHVKSICSYCKIPGHLQSVCLRAKSDTNQIEVVEYEDNPILEELIISKLDDQISSKIWQELHVNDVPINFEVDTGSPVTLLSLDEKNTKFPDFPTVPTKLKLITYCGTNLDVVGVMEVKIHHKKNDFNAKMYIVNSNRHPLLGREWMKSLNLDWNSILNTSINTIETSNTNQRDQRVDTILEKYSSVFNKSIGKIEGIEASINLKIGAVPVYCKARSIPFAVKGKVEAEIDNLVREGVLIKVNYSEWATPLVPVLKANGSVRLCGDFKITVNPNLIVDDHPLPTIEELFESMAGGEKFTKIDLTQAYLQLPVRDSDQHIMTLNTHKGLYQPTRLMYGIASAPAIWQRQIEMILQDINGVSVFLDDIKITGPDDETHLKRLDEVLARLAAHNMRINLSKCAFFTQSIEYCGYLIDKAGIHKLHSKVDAMQNLKRPETVEQVRAFVGLINYYGRFLQNLSTTIYPINNLLKKNVEFEWDADCETAFIAVKQQLQAKDFLVHYNPNLPLVLATDASSYGVGAVLSHIFPDKTERPIQYASQTLSAVQQRYTQIDKEAYAIIFGVKKFAQYLFGRKFILQVDNKPLMQILAPHKGLPTFAAMRMQHYELFLRSFQFDIKFRKTEDHANADALSRLPLKFIPSDDRYEGTDVLEINIIETLPVRVSELAEATLKDKNVTALLQGLRTGREVPSRDRFNIDQQEFTLQENCLMRGMRVYIPQMLRSRVLEELHSAHFGVSRMKMLARSFCWWEGIDYDIESISKDCSNCQSMQPNPVKVPLHSWEIPRAPFERIHADFAGPFLGTYFFIIVDAFSKWPEVHTLRSITARNTIEICRNIFARFGLPSVYVSDHGTQFTSAEFQQFLQVNGIQHKMGAPYHPATNGLAERYVRTIKEKLKCLNCHQDNMNQHINHILLNYRITVHPTTGKSPSMMMFNRNIRSRFDLMIPSMKSSKDSWNDVQVRILEVGARVSVREYVAKDIKWRFGYVIEKLGKLHYFVQLDDGRTWKRHIDQIRVIGENAVDKNLGPFFTNHDDHQELPTTEPIIPPQTNQSTESQSNDNENPTTIDVSDNALGPAIANEQVLVENNISKSQRIKKPVIRMNL